MEERERLPPSARDGYEVVEREPALYKRVRFKEDQRCRFETQTDTSLECKECKAEVNPVPMIFNVAAQLGYVLPPKRASKLSIGKTYIRRHSKDDRDWEFVKKIAPCEEVMCKKCKIEPEAKARLRRASAIARKDAALAARIRQLKAELATSEERAIEQRIGVRERRPYHFSSQRIVADVVIDEAAPDPPKDGCSRRGRADDGALRPCPEQCGCRRHGNDCHHHHIRRPFHHMHRGNYVHRYLHHYNHRPVYVEPIYCPPLLPPNVRRVKEVSPPSSDSQNQSDTTSIFQRIVIPRRRRRSSDNGCRISIRQNYCDPSVVYETRAPEDYYCRY